MSTLKSGLFAFSTRTRLFSGPFPFSLAPRHDIRPIEAGETLKSITKAAKSSLLSIQLQTFAPEISLDYKAPHGQTKTGTERPNSKEITNDHVKQRTRVNFSPDVPEQRSTSQKQTSPRWDFMIGGRIVELENLRAKELSRFTIRGTKGRTWCAEIRVGKFYYLTLLVS